MLTLALAFLCSADAPPRSSMLSQFTVADVSTLEDGDEDGEYPMLRIYHRSRSLNVVTTTALTKWQTINAR